MKSFDYIKHVIRDRKLVLAIVAAVGVALIVTTVNIWLYNQSDVSRIDASIPGRESIRSKLTTAKSTINFDASGPLDTETLDTFQGLFDKQRTALDALGKFEGDELKSDSLGLTATNQ